MYHIITPAPSRAADRLAEADDALLVAARRALRDAIEGAPVTVSGSSRAPGEQFARGVLSLSIESRRADVPIEKLIIALKLAWASTPEIRSRLGETSLDTLSTIITQCIETYYLVEPRARAD